MGHPLLHTERSPGWLRAPAAALLLAAALAATIFGCGVTQAGASDPDLAQAKSRANRGATLFETACATCHGPRGEGLAGAPTILGVTGLPRYPRDQAGVQLYQDPNQVQRQNQDRVPGVASRVEFVTANDLHGYVKQHSTEYKPPSGATALTDEDCWAIVNFMLIAHGSNVPAGEISAANASEVLIRAQ